MAIVFIAAVLICLLLLLVLYRNLPNKKVFYGFCLVLALTIGAIGQALLFQPKAEPPSEIALRRIAAETGIGEWILDPGLGFAKTFRKARPTASWVRELGGAL